MARRPARHRLRRSDLWPFAMVLLMVIGVAPLEAQLLGWWEGSDAQRAAATALMTGLALALLATDTLRGQRHRVVVRRRLHGGVIAFLGLTVAFGIVVALSRVMVLVGALSALPAGTLQLQLAMVLCYLVVLCARLWVGPERLVL